MDVLDRDVRQLLIDKAFINCRRCIPESALLDHANFDTHFDRALRAMVIDLDTYILGLADEMIEVHRKWPKTWWDAFKERWFPAWALRRWPVVHERIDIEEKRYKAVCPHLHLQVPDQNVHMRWLASKQWKDVDDTPRQAKETR